VGADWVSRHPNAAEGGASRCQGCHGTDYRGTVLSRALGDRTLDTRFGAKVFWKGFQIGCYTCHRGPSSEQANTNAPPVVTDTSATTPPATPVSLALAAMDPDPNTLTLRIVRQPEHGAVGLSGRTATYFPEPGFSGSDTFTFAASDGSTDSNLGTASVVVADGILPTPAPRPRQLAPMGGLRPTPREIPARR
jgi:hypothetical protein